MSREEKRQVGSYVIEQSLYIGEKEVLFGVNKQEDYPFMVCYPKLYLYGNKNFEKIFEIVPCVMHFE